MTTANRCVAERWLHFHWSQQVVPDALLPVPTALNAVWCPSAASCLAVGRAEDPHSSALAYQWSGAAWTALADPKTSDRHAARSERHIVLSRRGVHGRRLGFPEREQPSRGTHG